MKIKKKNSTPVVEEKSTRCPSCGEEVVVSREDLVEGTELECGVCEAGIYVASVEPLGLLELEEEEEGEGDGPGGIDAEFADEDGDDDDDDDDDDEDVDSEDDDEDEDGDEDEDDS